MTSSASTTPTAKKRGVRGRWRPRAWFDARLVIGICLVLASVLGVYFIVAEADRTTPAYSAKESISSGDHIRAADLVQTEVRLGSAAELYLMRESMPTDGVVATRAIAAGELIPLSAVGTTSGVTETSVVVGISGQLAESIRAGMLVDMWAARAIEHGRFGPPAVMIPAATVLGISEQEGMMARSGSSAVEILIPKAKVAAALEAIANSDAISLVPVSRAVGQ